MTTNTRKTILRANAAYLMIASIGGLFMDVAGIFFATGLEILTIAFHWLFAVLQLLAAVAAAAEFPVERSFARPGQARG